jgi:hypothetical protein
MDVMPGISTATLPSGRTVVKGAVTLVRPWASVVTRVPGAFTVVPWGPVVTLVPGAVTWGGSRSVVQRKKQHLGWQGSKVACGACGRRQAEAAAGPETAAAGDPGRL